MLIGYSSSTLRTPYDTTYSVMVCILASWDAHFILLMTLFHDPVVQKPHLFLRMKPMLTAFHDGENGMVVLCKIADDFPLLEGPFKRITCFSI